MKEHFSKRLFGTDEAAMTARNKRARQLRKQGIRVECRANDFSGFGYGREYVLEYEDPAMVHVEGRPAVKRKIDSGIDPS